MSEIILGRDWLGIVPLHYMLVDNRVVVASTIKELMKDSAYDWKNVRTVRSGCEERVDLQSQQVTTQRYYSLPELDIRDNPELASQRLRVILDYERESLSGITATMLSGGMDSIIASYLAKQTNPDIKAYTLTIKGQESKDADLHYAKKAAKVLGLKLVVVKVSAQDAIKAVDEAIFASEDKKDYNVFSAVGALLLGRKIVQDGHKEVLCGEGPDEIFGSYDPWYSHRVNSVEAKQPEFRRKFVKRLEWNLSRGTKTFDYLGMHVVSPYLTREFVEYGVNLPPKTVNVYSHRKGILGKAFEDAIPISLLLRPKVRFQDGTGITPILVDAGINCRYLEDSFDRQFHVR
jgi:asparagine synthase (glutamine-hydrolysing)